MMLIMRIFVRVATIRELSLQMHFDRILEMNALIAVYSLSCFEGGLIVGRYDVIRTVTWLSIHPICDQSVD